MLNTQAVNEWPPATNNNNNNNNTNNTNTNTNIDDKNNVTFDPGELTVTQQMAASSAGAMITSIFVTPLDVVKIRLQAQQKAFMTNKCFLYCNGLMDHLCPCVNGKNTSLWFKDPTVRFNGTLDAFVKIVQIEGVASLWSGLPPTLIMAVPATVIYFSAYERLRNYFTKSFKNRRYEVVAPTLAGGSARFLAAAVISPLELVRTKMQSKKMVYKDVGNAVRDLVRYGGVISLWRGFIPSVFRDVPFSAIYWTNYEFLKARYGGGQSQHFWFSFSAGAISGTIAAVLTLPFDVVKTHRQIELGEKEIYSDPPQKSANTYAILKRIYYQSGPAALFTGIVPRVIKVAPACAIMISTYEYGKAFFRRYNEVKSKTTK